MSELTTCKLFKALAAAVSFRGAWLGGSLALPERVCLRYLVTAPLIAILLFIACTHPSHGQDDDEPAEPPAGLIGTYTGADGVAHSRIDERLRFTWDKTSPDPRVPIGAFTARWAGNLAIQSPGSYRISVYAGGGTVELKLGGKSLIDGAAQKPGWLESAAVELDFGAQPLEVTFRAAGPAAQIGLLWSGPKFQLEPIPPRLLSHAAGSEALKQFDEGRLLARALRCAACHDLPDAQPILPAPALSHISGNLDHEWLMTWVGGKAADAAQVKAQIKSATASENDAQSETAQTPVINDVKFRMPGLGVSRADAQHIVAWLTKHSQPAPPKSADEKELKATAEADREAGQELFLTLGCLACHQFKSLGVGGVYGGGDLTAVGAKRPAEFFARWLATPEMSNPAHRMPVFPLSPEQRADLAKFLSEQGPPETSPKDEPAGDPERGAELISAHRCAACHALDTDKNKTAPPAVVNKRRLTKDADFSASCLGEPDAVRHRPGYRLRPDQRASVEQYIREITRAPVAESSPTQSLNAPIDAAQLVTERNCLSCHTRGLHMGIVANSPALAEAHPELATLLPALAPPSLNDVGDKLEREAIIAAFTTKDAPLRPWLKIRMPRFPFTPEESQALAAWFAETDLIPDHPAAAASAKAPHTLDDQALTVAGRRLVTAEGFGCASCHQIGRAVPKQDNIAAMGTDLSLVGRRIRRSWYDRWVRNPARIVPRMEMPSIELPVRGVLDEKLDDQLAAVWHVLNLPNFTPPEPGAVRVVRRRNLPDAHEPTAVLTDVITINKHPFIRPLIAALPNRHTVLFDLEQNRLAGWWLGDAAAQRTRGKTWFWEAAGTHLLDARAGEPELELRVGGKLLKPVVRGQHVAELDLWRHSDAGVTAEYRLHFAPDDTSEPPITLRVTQTITPTWASANKPGGFVRSIEVDGLPDNAEIAWRLLPEKVAVTIDEGRAASRGGSDGPLEIRYGQPARGRIEVVGGVPVAVMASEANKAAFSATYTSSLVADQFPLAPPPAVPFPAATLDVTPGWNSVRLPLPGDPMPTAFAWRKDGTMIFTSLKGQVWSAADTNSDGLADRLTAISDELAAPYGVVTGDNFVDVINKNGVVRLTDFGPSGQAQRSDIVASGWGHTDDYHDWAVGIVPDGANGYFTAIPCWQDKRDVAATKFRGEALRLAPRQPTPDNPRLFEIEPFCGGVRFPMGLARNRAGMLFASDNQGNYNPFNELNYLQSGAHYGFFNKQASTEGRPPRRDPAIEIPHPWTRSVNGICFLETPDALRKQTGKDQFGPWEGHLIGCEYDTRRLVRMSLQQVAGTVQGAVYPLSVEPAEDAETFEGPVSCAVGPDGALYIGNIRDSGWGGGQNTGSIVRMTVADAAPAGIAEVLATSDGFTVKFTQSVDAARGADAANYDVASYRRISTPDYGGPDVDRQPSRISKITLSADRLQARVALDRLREGFVYEIRIRNLTADKDRFHPAEAFYTLRKIPEITAAND